MTKKEKNRIEKRDISRNSKRRKDLGRREAQEKTTENDLIEKSPSMSLLTRI